MKSLLSLLIIFISLNMFAQEPYKDGKKWGLSKFGEGPDSEGDTVFFAAEFDEIIDLSVDYGFAYAAAKNDEWIFLSRNKKVSQQRYESIVSFESGSQFSYGIRSGYIDVVDFSTQDFLIRSVKADGLLENQELDVSELILTYFGKDKLGVINTTTKKEILKADHISIIGNYQNLSIAGTFLAFKEGKNYLYDYEGNLLHTFESPKIITEVKDYDAIDDCFLLIAETKKTDLKGFYDTKNKWYVPPLYLEIMFLEDIRDMVIVLGDKGLGLYFHGTQILPCEFLEITKSDREGYVAIAITKNEEFYVANNGDLIPKESDY
jgi:hypothetical protein